MNGSDEQFARRIAAILDRSAENVSPGIAYRLREARARALDGAAEAASEPAMVHALAGGSVARAPSALGGAHARRMFWRFGAVVVLAGAVLFGIQQWKVYRDAQAYSELDAQLLSSDLPIDAYLDKGFDAWLKATYDE